MNIANSSITSGEEANLQSIETIAWMQEKFLPYEWWIVQTSVFGDNREAFLVFFPIITGFLNLLGVRVLWAAILSDWLNLILKWIFKGDRPYWWVPQSNLYTDSTRPVLRQFANTCESGPGTPSGHLMINVAIFYIVFRGLSKYIWNSKRYRITKALMSGFTFALYVSWISLVFISRLYIQSHFLHQCILGVVIGLFVGQIVWSSSWLVKSHTFGSVLFSSWLAGSSISMYFTLLKKGLDPLWAIPLAIKYCAKAEYVSLDTQPYFIMVRFSAAAVGLGFALNSKNRRMTQNVPRSLLRTILCIKAGLLFGRVVSLAQKTIPTDDLTVYLASSFALQMLFPYVIVVVIPYIVLQICPPKKTFH